MHLRELFLKHQAQTSPSPLLLDIEKAEGIYMYNAQGKAYIDLISGIGVSNVGHRHPSVLKAIQEQLDKYLHLMVYGEIIQSPQVLLAEALVQTLPASLDNVYLVNSGSEAVEGALKLAKRYTGRSGLISFVNAYHGSSHGALSVGGNEYFKQAYRPLLPDVKHLPFNSQAHLEEITNQTAAVIVEVVQGEAGVRVGDPEFMQALAKRCKDTGALLIADEIQTGFGRTGTFWAFEKYGIVPDVVVSAKGMGGGMPIGAFIASKEIMSVLTHLPVLGHITTFGGHPVSCAAALACLRVIKEGDLMAQVKAKADLFIQHLKHPSIKEIRHCGLIMAVEFESFDLLQQIIQRALDKGVLTDWFLFCDNSMRIAPPLIISEEEIKKSCGLLMEAINDVLL